MDTGKLALLVLLYALKSLKREFLHADENGKLPCIHRLIKKHFVKKEFGCRKLRDIRKSDVRRFYNGLLDTKQLKVNTLESIHTVVHQLFNLAVDDLYIRGNPSDGVMGECKRAHNMVYYQRDKGKCYFSVTTTKTEAGSRIIPLLPEVRQALFDEKAYQKEAELVCQANIDGYTDFVFLNRYGNPHNPQTINRTIKRITLAYNEEETELP